MKILVPISTVPDTTAKISFTDNNTQFDTNNVQFILNPTDEWYALVRAIELKEKLGGTVTVINVGLADSDQYIRKALAIGADNAVRVNAEPTDAFQVASNISNHAKAGGYDLVIAGKETINYNGFQIGGMVAEMLDMAYVGNVTNLEIDGSTATMKREIEGGVEVVEVNLPMVIGAAKGLAEQRIPNMRGIMAARTKPLTVEEGVGADAYTEVANYNLPPEKTACKMIDPENVGELVKLLHEEAKVI